MSISSKALLVNLHIKQWLGKAVDKRATSTVETTHLTDKRVGNYTKKLLPGAKELEEVSRLAGSIRVFFYEQTLPWASDGSRIISSKNYFDFTAAFRQKKNEFDSAVNAFLFKYPELKEQAKIKLGNLFEESEYPEVNDLQHLFDCFVNFLPVPDVNDFRVEITDQEKQAFLKTMSQVEETALKNCWDRLHHTVIKAADKLSEPNAIFRDSLIYNIQEICELLPKLNVTDDNNLETIRKEVQSVVSKIQPEICRENVDARNEAVKKLDLVLDKMSEFMSG